MKPPKLPCFSENDLSADCNSVSSEEINSMTAVSLLIALRLLLSKAEIPQKRKITGFQPCPCNASANAGVRAEPSSVTRQSGFSGIFLRRNPGEASGTACARPSFTRCSATANSDFEFRSFFLQAQKILKKELE